MQGGVWEWILAQKKGVNRKTMTSKVYSLVKSCTNVDFLDLTNLEQ